MSSLHARPFRSLALGIVCRGCTRANGKRRTVNGKQGQVKREDGKQSSFYVRL